MISKSKTVSLSGKCDNVGIGELGNYVVSEVFRGYKLGLQLAVAMVQNLYKFLDLFSALRQDDSSSSIVSSKRMVSLTSLVENIGRPR